MPALPARHRIRDVRAAVSRRLRALDAAAGRLSGRRRVLLEARVPMEFIALRPVFERLRRDVRLDVRLTFDGRADLAETFAREGVAERVLSRAECEWQRFDLYLNADPWDPVPLRRCAARMSIFHGVAGKYDLDQPPREAQLFDAYDRVGFANSDRMQRYLSGRVIAPSQAVLVGYPKLDLLANRGIDPAAVLESLRLRGDRPIVLYAPTWSPASSLHLAGEAIIETLLSLDLNVIAKLHDNCFMPGAKYAGDIDWRARLRRFEISDRFALAPGVDSTPYLAAADLMVTDHSSIGFEFLMRDRPLIVYDAPELPRVARINPEKIALLRSAADVVLSVEELSGVVRAALATPERLRTRRKQVSDAIFHDPGRATDRTVAVIYDLIALTPPAALPAYGTSAGAVAVSVQ